MAFKVGIIIGDDTDNTIMQESVKVLKEFEVPFEINKIEKNNLNETLKEYAQKAYSNGVRVIIAGTRGDVNFANAVSTYFTIPTIGVPCKSLNTPNTVESVFKLLQQPNDNAVANVALDSGQNAALLAIQILALGDSALQKKMIDFKENLKNKILKADKEMAQFKFNYRTN